MGGSLIPDFQKCAKGLFSNEKWALLGRRLLICPLIFTPSIFLGISSSSRSRNFDDFLILKNVSDFCLRILLCWDEKREL